MFLDENKLATPCSCCKQDEDLMNHTHLVKPQIPLGLDDQRNILNQMYRLALNASITL